MGSPDGYAEIVNAGVPEHAAFDSLGRYKEEGRRCQPDIVVICNQWNDFKCLTTLTLLPGFS